MGEAWSSHQWWVERLHARRLGPKCFLHHTECPNTLVWFFLWVRVSLYILTSFKLDILLPQPSECLDYRCLFPSLSVPAFLRVSEMNEPTLKCRQEGGKLKASLGYLQRTCFKKPKAWKTASQNVKRKLNVKLVNISLMSCGMEYCHKWSATTSFFNVTTFKSWGQTVFHFAVFGMVFLRSSSSVWALNLWPSLLCLPGRAWQACFTALAWIVCS